MACYPSIDYNYGQVVEGGASPGRRRQNTMNTEELTVVQIFFLAVIFPAMFGGIIVFLEIGRRVRLAQIRKDPGQEGKGLEVIEGAIFGLMALLIAFTFSGAASRFENRRQLVVEEANCIGTAYLRLHLLPEENQESLREKFRKYTDSRIEMHNVLPNAEAAHAAFARSTRIQGEIWKEALAAARSTPDTPPMMLVVPALNEMFDIATTRYMAVQFHTPTPILLLLIFLTWFCSLLAGFRMASDEHRRWVHMAVFAMLMSLTIYTIIDFEYPRAGLIDLEGYDNVMHNLRASMK
jgi:hypothetical protein